MMVRKIVQEVAINVLFFAQKGAGTQSFQVFPEVFDLGSTSFKIMTKLLTFQLVNAYSREFFVQGRASTKTNLRVNPGWLGLFGCSTENLGPLQEGVSNLSGTQNGNCVVLRIREGLQQNPCFLALIYHRGHE